MEISGSTRSLLTSGLLGGGCFMEDSATSIAGTVHSNETILASHPIPPTPYSSSLYVHRGVHCSSLASSSSLGVNSSATSIPFSSSCITSSFSSTKVQLAQVQENISSFEKQMENEAKQRRESEEERLAAVRDALAKLEKTLNGEIRRRVDSSNALQTTFERQIKEVHEKLEKIFVDKLDFLQTTIDILNSRMNVVENEFYTEREKHLKALEHKNIVVAKELTDLQREFDAEKGDRQNREAVILRKLSEIEQKCENKFEQERLLREKKYEIIEMDLHEAKQSREEADIQFQNLTFMEVSKIKELLVNESKAREEADDDIVQAVNHYTKALQDSVRLLNSA